MDLKEALTECLDKQPLTFSIENNIITIHAKPPVQSAPLEKAAPRKITGRMMDEHAKPMPGVTIKVMGNALNATISTTQGFFSIIVPDDNTVLQFSFVGFLSLDILVKKLPDPAIIVMKEDISNLDQVQVVAYGTTTKRFNTGNVTTITAEDIAKNPVQNVLEAIQGKVPGLFVQQTTGQPGGAISLRLRDAANFNGASGTFGAVNVGAPTPLIVVDGVTYPGATLPMETNTLFGTGNFLQGGNGLNFLNPNDIESVSVLKDADATSLYGAEGAYGVILITTKKARPGPASFNVNIYDGVSMLGQAVTPMTTTQYLTLRREAIKNDGGTVGSGDYDLNGTFPTTRNNNYQKELLGNIAQTSNINLTYGGGTQNTSYIVSGSLQNTGNIQLHKGKNMDGSMRFSLSTNTPDNKFSYSISGTYLSNVNTMVPTDFSSITLLTPPNAPEPFLPDGSVNWTNYGGTASATAADINRTYHGNTNNLVASTNLIYRPVKHLGLHTNVGYNNISGSELMGYPTTTLPPSTANAGTRTVSIYHNYTTRNITIEPFAEYTNNFWQKGDFSFKIGGKLDNNLQTTSDINGTGFASDALLSNPSVGTTVTTAYSYTPYRDVGEYAIMKFIWDQKYIINLNGRRDGSTKFGPGKKFGNFGSAAAAWIFSEEKFIKNNLPFLSYGKLRASTGIVGGDAIGAFNYLSKYTAGTGTYAGKTTLSPANLANPDLSWEHNRNSEVSLEFGFLKDRIYIEGNYYYNVASNQLISVPLPAVTGFVNYPINTNAVIRTSGWEMALRTTEFKSKNFSWVSSFNISIPMSKLEKLPTNYNLNSSYILNKPVTGTLLFNYDGVNPQTGNFSYINSKGGKGDYSFSQLAAADKTQFVDLAPKYYGGFQNTLTYKHLSLDFMITFTSRVGENALAQNGFPVGYYGVNGSNIWLNRWQKPGDITNVPKLGAGVVSLLNFYQVYAQSTGAYSDATYARLQNVDLRYSFDDQLLKKLHLKGLSVYMQGQNLFTVSNLGGLDPENLSLSTIPPMRVITLGLNATL
jgi:TonB-linked SusC/RagA family outer membrane protein